MCDGACVRSITACTIQTALCNGRPFCRSLPDILRVRKYAGNGYTSSFFLLLRFQRGSKFCVWQVVGSVFEKFAQRIERDNSEMVPNLVICGSMRCWHAFWAMAYRLWNAISIWLVLRTTALHQWIKKWKFQAAQELIINNPKSCRFCSYNFNKSFISKRFCSF